MPWNAWLGDRALADPGQAHGLDQLVDAPGRDAPDPVDPLRGSTLDDGHEPLLASLPRLGEGREVGALPELRHAQLQCTGPRVERALPVAVAVVQALDRA